MPTVTSKEAAYNGLTPTKPKHKFSDRQPDGQTTKGVSLSDYRLSLFRGDESPASPASRPSYLSAKIDEIMAKFNGGTEGSSRSA